MAAFILQLFHKLEKKTALGNWDIPCKCLRHKVNQASAQQAIHVATNQRAVEENQGHNQQHNVQVNDHDIIIDDVKVALVSRVEYK